MNSLIGKHCLIGGESAGFHTIVPPNYFQSQLINQFKLGGSE